MRRALAVAIIIGTLGGQTALAAPAPKPVARPSAKPAAALSAKPAAAPNAAKVSEASGTVMDQTSGRPIAGAYVFQPGSLNGVVTDGQGHFRLVLDPKYGQDVQVSHESFEPLQLTATADPMIVRLSPLTSFQAFTQPVVTKPGQKAIDSLFNLYYQMQNQAMASGTGQLNGLVTNQMTAQGQFRLGNFLFRGEGSRNRVPVDVEGFPFKPSVNFDTWQARLGASYAIQLGTPMLEVALGPEYMVNFIQADNRSGQDAKPIPYTNTFVDRFPVRQGLGANLLLGFRPISPLYIAADASYHPVVFGSVETGTAPLGNMQYWSAGIRVDYSLFTGVGLGVAYKRYSWFGDLTDNADQFSIGLSFNPYLLN